MIAKIVASDSMNLQVIAPLVWVIRDVAGQLRAQIAMLVFLMLSVRMLAWSVPMDNIGRRIRRAILASTVLGQFVAVVQVPLAHHVQLASMIVRGTIFAKNAQSDATGKQRIPAQSVRYVMALRVGVGQIFVILAGLALYMVVAMTAMRRLQQTQLSKHPQLQI